MAQDIVETADRPAPQYVADVNAGWQWRVVLTSCGGRPRYLVCEVLQVGGKVTLARPLKAPASSSAELLRGALGAMSEAVAKASARELLEVDGELVDWTK